MQTLYRPRRARFVSIRKRTEEPLAAPATLGNDELFTTTARGELISSDDPRAPVPTGDFSSWPVGEIVHRPWRTRRSSVACR